MQEIVVATSESLAVMTGRTFSNFSLGKRREKLQKWFGEPEAVQSDWNSAELNAFSASGVETVGIPLQKMFLLW